MNESAAGRAGDILDWLDATLPEQERVLEAAARNVQLGLERDSEIYRAFTQLQFFILMVDFDLRIMLRSMLTDPQNRLTSEKFLALTVEESDESAGRMINAVSRAMRAFPNDTGAHLFDIEKFERAVGVFKQAMLEMRSDKEFKRTLRLIRNTISGHIVGDEVGVQNGAIWVLTRQGVPRNTDGVLRSKIVYYAIATLVALSGFARGLQRTCRI